MPDDQTAIDPRVALFERLYSDPDTGPVLDSAIKAKFPHASIPRHEARQAAVGAVSEIRKEREAWSADVQKDRDERALRSARDEAVAAGVNRADLPAVEKLMQERGILRHQDAAALLEMERTAAAPRSSPDLSGWDLPGTGASAEDYKGIIGADGKASSRWARQKAHEAIAELEAQRGGGRGTKWNS